MENERCPRHGDPTLCAALRRAMEAEASVRFVVGEDVAMAAWDNANARLAQGWCDEFLEAHETCDCWKLGVGPFPSMARSALLYHVPLPEASGLTAGQILEDEPLCPAWRAWLLAENTAAISFFRVSSSTARGLSLRDIGEDELGVIRLEPSARDLKKDDLIFARTVHFAGVERMLECEGDPRRGAEAAEAIRRFHLIDPLDFQRPGKLLEAWRHSEPPSRVALPAGVRRSGTWKN
ncbi:MAG TPA: hypothetical protein VMV18_10350 [bacterium]|nr:hypothetical protein [bacterium]